MRKEISGGGVDCCIGRRLRETKNLKSQSPCGFPSDLRFHSAAESA